MTLEIIQDWRLDLAGKEKMACQVEIKRLANKMYKDLQGLIDQGAPRHNDSQDDLADDSQDLGNSPQIGLLYSANEEQVDMINKLKKGESVPGKDKVSRILRTAGGQGAVFRELYRILEKDENKNLLNAITLFPIGTSRKGRANVAGNVASLDKLNESIDAVREFACVKNHYVYGLLRQNSTGEFSKDDFAIGNGTSVFFYGDDKNTGVRERDPNRVVAYNQDGSAITQGMYVQSQLKQIRSDTKEGAPQEGLLPKIEESIYSRSVRQALATYQENLNTFTTRLSFFHRHGEDGLNNAYDLLRQVLCTGQSMCTIKQTILNHLESGPGNKHAHSFKTILVKKLFENAKIVASCLNYKEILATLSDQLPTDVNQENEIRNRVAVTC